MKKIITLVITAALLTSTGCNEREHIGPNYQPSEVALKTLFSNNLESITQRTTFDDSTGIDFVSNKGVHLTIHPNGLKSLENVPVTGNVELTYVEIFDRGTMLVTNKPTVGIKAGEKQLITTGGEFFINIS